MNKLLMISVQIACMRAEMAAEFFEYIFWDEHIDIAGAFKTGRETAHDDATPRVATHILGVS